jgi:hypothetical protein
MFRLLVRIGIVYAAYRIGKEVGRVPDSRALPPGQRDGRDALGPQMADYGG